MRVLVRVKIILRWYGSEEEGMSEDIILGSLELTALSKLLKKLVVLSEESPSPHPQFIETYRPYFSARDDTHSTMSTTIPPNLMAKRKQKSVSVPMDTVMLSKIETEAALRKEAGIPHTRTEIIREAVFLYFMERAKGMPIWHMSNIIDKEERQWIQNIAGGANAK